MFKILSLSLSEIGCRYVSHALAVSVIGLLREWVKPKPPYSAGPKGYPIFGNPWDIPGWEGFTSVAHKYGVYRLNNSTHRQAGPNVHRNGCFAIEVWHESYDSEW